MIPITPRGRFDLVATTTRGLEGVLRQELIGLGHADAVEGRGVVRFSGDLAAIYRANLWLRAAMRILAKLAEGKVRDRAALYELAGTVEWERWLRQGQTFAVEVAGQSSALSHTGFAALVVKDALVDRLRHAWGSRPDVSRARPDVVVHVHLTGEGAAISLDSSGDALSHRGYRPAGGTAPLAETLAAGMLLLAGYDGSMPLLDPMCGAGTLPIEAALIATARAPGALRGFGCERWHFHDAGLLASIRAERKPRPQAVAAIVGRDIDPRAAAAARRNAAAAGVGDCVRFEAGDVRSRAFPPGTGVIVANPPYGVRLGDRGGLRDLYRALGDALKRHGAGATAWLLLGDLELAKEIGLRASRRIVLFNGPIECRLLRFDVYAGSNRSEKRSAAMDGERRAKDGKVPGP